MQGPYVVVLTFPDSPEVHAVAGPFEGEEEALCWAGQQADAHTADPAPAKDTFVWHVVELQPAHDWQRAPGTDGLSRMDSGGGLDW